MQLYKKIESINNNPIKVLYGPNNTFTEIYPNNELRSWRRLLSGFYIKLSQDWVPTEVIHQQLAPPLQVEALEEGLGDERLVQRWIEHNSGKSSSKPAKPEQLNSFSLVYQQQRIQSPQRQPPSQKQQRPMPQHSH